MIHCDDASGLVLSIQLQSNDMSFQSVRSQSNESHDVSSGFCYPSKSAFN